MRLAKVKRKTKETKIEIKLNLDGDGNSKVNTGLKFFDHMLSSMIKYSRFDITVVAKGDIDVDDHHTIEDVGICIGKALDKALGRRKGISRFGHSFVVMDDSLSFVSLDMGGRGYHVLDLVFSSEKIGDITSQNIPHFLESFAREGRFNIFAKTIHGTNDHHKAESLFKALGISLNNSCKVVGKEVPSTKGVI